ncbi:CheR family methyltransferase [Photobacterium toruni]|uniref:CheR family methyltransferase n=1 Tax=Photobacterium toruni TaxID=1935446 RepID=UPI00210FCD47|nr:protein-glutamate O-methyltransferase CheR [Photobacterium toruni]
MGSETLAMIISTQEYKEFCRFLEAQCGIVLSDGKQYLVRSRLSPLMTKVGISTISELLQLIKKSSYLELKNNVINAMTTNETLWFRDIYPFKVLQSKIFPELIDQKKNIRIWSAASSSGQEAYSIAMTVLETQTRLPRLLNNVSIVGTDISSEMLNACKAGIYDELAMNRGLSAERRRFFFEDNQDGRMRLSDKVKKMVTFRPQNLKDSYALLGKFDIIFCRNVLIYFAPEMKEKVLSQIATQLNPGGYLFLGASETLGGLSNKFEMIRCEPGIAYRLKQL